MATFPEDDIAVNNLLASDMNSHDHSNGATVQFDQPSLEVGSEQTVETTEEPQPVGIIKVTNTKAMRKIPNNSLKPGRHLIGPGDKVVRIVKGGGMLVSKKKKKDEPEGIFPDMEPIEIKSEIKQEVVDPSPLHELAELSMQHAQSMFKCEMCSEVFSDRAQLLVHVPIHI